MKPDHLTPNEALNLIYGMRNLSDAALLVWHIKDNDYFANDLADNFDRMFEIMQEINDARRHRRARAEQSDLAQGKEAFMAHHDARQAEEANLELAGSLKD
jgi:hypothetical protein